MVTLDNSDDVYNGSNADITVLANSTVSINGSDNTISAASGDTTTVTGGGNVIQAGSDTFILGGTGALADVISGTTLDITLDAASHLTLNASEVNLNLGVHCVVVATGDNFNFTGSDDKIFSSLALVGGDEITGNSNRNIVAANSLLEVFGNSNYVHLGDKASVAITGTDERLVGAGFYVSAAAGSDFWIGGTGVGGADDLVTVSNCTIRIGANSDIALKGDDDTVAVRGGSHVFIQGTGLLAHFGRNAVVLVTGAGQTAKLDTVTGAYFTANVNTSSNVELATFGATSAVGADTTLAVERSNNVITAGQSDTISILWGSANQVTLGLGDTISDGGIGSVFQAGDVGATTINNFAADPTGIIELLGGVGGYATQNDAYSALKGDGMGGVSLSLGADGSIDFAGTLANQLSAANFKIG